MESLSKTLRGRDNLQDRSRMLPILKQIT